MDVKECKAYIKQCIRDYPANSFILDLDTYPLTKCVVVHNDGKAWGYFRNGEEFLSFGRNGNLAAGFLVCTAQYNLTRAKNYYIITNNPEIKRVYTRLLKNWNSIWRLSFIRDVLRWNPRLVANLFDLLEENASGLADLFYIARYTDKIDITQSTVRKACNLPTRYALAGLLGKCRFSKLRLCASNNIPIDDIYNSQYFFDYIPDKYITHKLVPYVRAGRIISTVYRDYVILLEATPDVIAKEFPTYPAVNKVEYWHNKLTDVYNRIRARIKTLENQELNKKYQENYYAKACEYEYSNSNYSIIACKSIEELYTEGSTLCHCVGSYANSISNGNEYILFLRKKNDIDTPYFTIDVDPNNNVRQIHGKRNCNVNDEIRPFIEEWAKKFNLDISNCNGVYCALR